MFQEISYDRFYDINHCHGCGTLVKIDDDVLAT